MPTLLVMKFKDSGDGVNYYTFYITHIDTHTNTQSNSFAPPLILSISKPDGKYNIQIFIFKAQISEVQS